MTKISTADFSRTQMPKTVWCPGCQLGNMQFALMNAAFQVISDQKKLRLPDKLKLVQNQLVIVGGIGCTSRLPGNVEAYTLHTTHGRALPCATGIKMVRPDLCVIAVCGDGDTYAIGGNHLIHAARKNINLTLVVYDNQSYGMTGAQHSPTSPEGMFAASAPHGTFEPAFDKNKLAQGAGAGFVAQYPVYDPAGLQRIFERAIRHKGFSLVNVLGTCHTGWGRINKYSGVEAMLQEIRDGVDSGSIPIGVLYENQEPDLQNRPAYLAAQERGQRFPAPKDELAEPWTEADDLLEIFPKTEIRFAGFGGQGIVLAGKLAAQAAVLDGKIVVYSKSYGPEARGGNCKSDVLVSAGPIYHPQTTRLDLLLALSQEVFEIYKGDVKNSGVMVVDSSHFEPLKKSENIWLVPFTRLAFEELQNPLVTNVIGLGFMARLTNAFSPESITRAVMAKVKAEYQQLNQAALEIGFREAGKILEGKN